MTLLKTAGKRVLKVVPIVTAPSDWNEASSRGHGVIVSAGHVVFEQFNPVPVTMIDLSKAIEYFFVD